MLDGWQRRLLAAALPVPVIAAAWASLQRGGAPGPFEAVVALSFVAALPASFRVRLPVAVAMLVGLTVVTAGSSAGRVRGVTDRGLRDIYDTAPPFDAASHHDLYVLVALAAGAFCLAVAVTAASKPLIAAALVTVGVAWPATLMPPRNTVTVGAFCVIVALWPLVVGDVDRRTLLPGVSSLAAVTAAAIVAAGVLGVNWAAALDWQNWDLLGQSASKRTVLLVWSSNYGGVDFPREKTVVLRINAPHRAQYWRATTLDLFTSHRWVEALYTTRVAGANRILPADPLLPRPATNRNRWVRQEVDVRAIVDDHIVAASQPMQIAGGAGHRVQYATSGVMRARPGQGDLRMYTVWSYVSRPTPAELVRSPPAYPAVLTRELEIGRATMPPFAAAGRTAVVSSIFHDQRYRAEWPYAVLWRQARRVTAGAQTPYQATVRIERWLRSDGGFGYDEHPPAPRNLPPLVDFVQRTKVGYCQQFAGTMALMLRSLGIPARVAVGFTSGAWKDGTWTVTDHDAHAWVEAWFAGYGWLTFDPTPGRGVLNATYTNASDSADAIRALGTGRFLGAGQSSVGKPAAVAPQQQEQRSRRSVWPFLLPVAVLLVALLGLAALKRGRSVARASSDDPRTIASAARADLVDFLRDQGSSLAATAAIGELATELRRLGVASEGFADAFSRARYGPAAGAAAAAGEARREASRVLDRLRDRLGPGQRARGFLTLRSLRGG